MALATGTFQLDEHQNISTFYLKNSEVHYYTIVVVTQLVVNQSQILFPSEIVINS